MNNLKDRLILLDTRNNKAFDLSSIGKVICEDFEDVNFLRCLNQIAGNLSYSLIQMAAVAEDGIDGTDPFFKDAALSIWHLNQIRASEDELLFTQLASKLGL
jgi:hypothetical protein